MIRRAVLAAALVLLLPQAADANIRSCSVSVGLLTFGTFSGSQINATNRIALTCNGTGNSNANPFTVALSEGGSNTFLDRFMFSGFNQLHYNLYIDPAHTLIWGSGAGQTRLQSGAFDFRGNIGTVTTNLTVYGEVQAQTLPTAGVYADLIVVTVVS